jgi:hypothetical protein
MRSGPIFLRAGATSPRAEDYCLFRADHVRDVPAREGAIDKHEFVVSPRVRHIRLAVYLVMDSLVPAPLLALVCGPHFFTREILWGSE